MVKTLLILFVSFISLSASPAGEITITRSRSAVATCKGAKVCKACKNCKYCKHCKKDGGTCGVCK